MVMVGGVIIGGGEAACNSNDNVDSGKKVSHLAASRVCIPAQVAGERWRRRDTRRPVGEYRV